MKERRTPNTRPNEAENTGTSIYEENLEEIVLAACLLEQDTLTAVLRQLRPEMFYMEKHRLIFSAIGSLYAQGTPIDILTVTEHLRRQGQLEEAGGAFYITRLSGRLASTAHTDTHCALLFEYYVRRELARRIMPLMADVTNVMADVFDIIVSMQHVLEALCENSPLENHLHTLTQVMEETIGLIERRQATARGGLTGIPTGLERLDEITGGWQNGNLIYVAGRPGDGKSALALHMALTAAQAGTPVVIYTLEMKATELGERIALAQTDIDPARLRQGRLLPQEMETLTRCREKAAQMPLCIDDTPYLSIDHLCTLVKAQHAKGKCRMVIVDYLQLLATLAPGRTREQEVAECSRKLKALARSIDSPVIVASQLNRQAEEQNTVPDLRHLRESGAIEQDADLVMLIHRPERHHISVDPHTGCSTRNMGILSVAKHRNGSTGKVYYSHNGSMTRFTSFVPQKPDAQENAASDQARRKAARLANYRSDYYQTSKKNPKDEKRNDLFGGQES